MEKVYLESSFISYLVSPQSRDLLTAANQQVTRDWWEMRGHFYDRFVSQIVLDEISVGDAGEARKRLEVIQGLPVLLPTAESEDLTLHILRNGLLPEKAAADAAHVATATVHQIDYLLTWNCKHLANAHIVRKLRRAMEAEGISIPTICTPQELMGEDDDG